MDHIIAEAKRFGMKLWILDDARFPTGFANGTVPDNLKKRYLGCHRYDIVGSAEEMDMDLSVLCNIREYYKDPKHQYDRIENIILAENDITEKTAFREDSLQDITSQLEDRTLHLYLERKYYSVFVIYSTSVCNDRLLQDYLDPTRAEFVKVLINEVYEKHYLHYQNEFGNTIEAFFSDEPRFGNDKGWNIRIGNTDTVLPWNEEIREELYRNGWHDTDDAYLFAGSSAKSAAARMTYMDVITRLYSRNFSSQIGEWCRRHGVRYVGHVIEDNGAHARLGYGPGHYFRAIAGQDMAGVDVIGGQIVPGMDYWHDAFNNGGSNGEFYHHALIELGASAAKLDPLKKGNLMCEAFGAYGWSEGLKMMKWIMDHCISHGVNVIVPHAFSPKVFPDRDCPPHFYADGCNPQFPYFHYLMSYTQRLLNLFSCGYHSANTGVLYHASLEWGADCMPVEKILKKCHKAFVSADIISADYLHDAVLQDNAFTISGYAYRTLIVPECVFMSDHLRKDIERIAEKADVLFINRMLEGYSGKGKVIPFDGLEEYLKNHCGQQMIRSEAKSLTLYEYCRNGENIYMLFNEDILQDAVFVPAPELLSDYCVYDAFTDTEYGIEETMVLRPYESVVLVKGHTDRIRDTKGSKIIEWKDGFLISMKSFDREEYEPVFLTETGNLAKSYPYFSGSVRYERVFRTDETECLILLKDVYEISQIKVNGTVCSVSFADEISADISKALLPSENRLEITVTNNLGRNQRDGLSSFMAMEPFGILKPVELYRKRVINHGNI